MKASRFMEEKVHPVTKLASSEGRRAEKAVGVEKQSAHPPATEGFAGLFHDILQCGVFPLLPAFLTKHFIFLVVKLH